MTTNLMNYFEEKIEKIYQKMSAEQVNKWTDKWEISEDDGTYSKEQYQEMIKEGEKILSVK